MRTRPSLTGGHTRGLPLHVAGVARLVGEVGQQHGLPVRDVEGHAADEGETELREVVGAAATRGALRPRGGAPGRAFERNRTHAFRELDVDIVLDYLSRGGLRPERVGREESAKVLEAAEESSPVVAGFCLPGLAVPLLPVGNSVAAAWLTDFLGGGDFTVDSSPAGWIYWRGRIGSFRAIALWTGAIVVRDWGNRAWR